VIARLPREARVRVQRLGAGDRHDYRGGRVEVIPEGGDPAICRVGGRQRLENLGMPGVAGAGEVELGVLSREVGRGSRLQ
jgi:hypothetical protein